MSLTWGLALAAGIVLFVVLGHSLWTTRQAAALRRTAGPSVLPDRVEPLLGDEAAADPRPAAARRAARLDALIDAIVPMTLESPVSGDAVIAHLPPTHRAGSKPFYIEGLDSESGDWQTLSAGRRYGELQAGVQLANRGGALNEIEYSEFVQKLQAFADAIGAQPDFPDMLDVVARARELDAFASPRDAQLTVELNCQKVAWSVGYLTQCAGRHGFVPGALPGRLVLPSAEEGAPPMLVLGFDAQAALSDDPEQSALRHCTLTLDVPQTPAAAEPFPAWHRAITGLTADLDALAVDDHGAQVTLHAFDAIGKELQQLYRQLESRDLAAGASVTRRLFSG